jgi:hypothetical protein
VTWKIDAAPSTSVKVPSTQPLTNVFGFYGGVACSADLEWAAVRYSDKDYVPHCDVVGIASPGAPRTYQTFAFGTVFDREGYILALQTVEQWEFLDLMTGEMLNRHPGAAVPIQGHPSCFSAFSRNHLGS